MTHGATERPIKVVHLITGLNAGGTERQLAALVLAGNKNEVDHSVVSLRTDGIWGPRIRAGGIPVTALEIAPARAALALPRVVAAITAARADVVQTWLYHSDLAGLLASRLAGRLPVIWTLRSAEVDLDAYGMRIRILLKALARLSRFPAAIVANSVKGLRWHESIGYRFDSAKVIANGIDCEQFRPDESARGDLRRELGLPPDALLVGNVSRHDAMKDHPNLLRAFAAAGGSAWLLLAGDGTGSAKEELSAQIAAAGVDPSRVLRLGPRTDVPRVLAALDVSVLSSSGEGFPNVVAEAMACGVCCVATDVGDVTRIVGDCGVVVPPRDSSALARALAGVLRQDLATRRADGERARERIRAGFSVEAMVEAYRDVYRDVVSRGKVARW